MTRRSFLSAGPVLSGISAPAALPWYRRATRWGQTNITEKDPERYDVAWWREYWKRTEVQGVIVNAGGIVAYYPSKFPLHRQAEFLRGRDLYGEVAEAAHRDGLFVLARMDSNRAAEDFFRAHPDWFARSAAGEPYRAADKFVACVSSGYYEEYLPSVLAEIAERSHPEGFTDNSWSGLGRDSICHCENCARRFRDRKGHALPRAANWDNRVYRDWIEWSYARRIEIWDLNNRAAKAAGGPDCLWIGMNSGSVTSQSSSFRNIVEIGARAEMLLLDHQARSDASGFEQNAEAGKLVHGVLGWNKLAPESMAMYQSARTPFRVSAKPAAEARMWMVSGFAGGIQPWWHHVGAYHEDRRAYKTAEPVMRWHKANTEYLVNREPVAAVGVVWSQRNTDFFGRDDAAGMVDAPYRGLIEALIRARIPYVPVNTAHIGREAGRLAVLALPNVGAMSEADCAAVRRFVEAGGGLLSTGQSSRYDEWGDARADFALADLFGAHAPAEPPARADAGRSHHSYLRLAPELRAGVWGPKGGGEPAPSGTRHPVLAGFEETDILPFGGMLGALRTDPGAIVPLTFIPPFPVYPPETAWMRTPNTDIPGLVLNAGRKGRVAFLAADIDRRFYRDNLPDHSRLLGNILRWLLDGRTPLEVRGPGLVDCHLYRQPGRLVLHMVNLTSSGTWRAPVEELIPLGPYTVRLRLPAGVRGAGARCLVAGTAAPIAVRAGWAEFPVPTIRDHEVVVVA
jgi:hypothetical protein